MRTSTCPAGRQHVGGFVVEDQVADKLGRHQATFVGRTPTPEAIISTCRST